MIEIELQNETHQTQDRVRFAAVPRIGEGIRLREPDGMWASYDVIDVWYQKAEFGDVWMPYLHVRITPGETPGEEGRNAQNDYGAESYGAHDYGAQDYGSGDYDAEEASDAARYNEHGEFASLAGEAEPFKI